MFTFLSDFECRFHHCTIDDHHRGAATADM